MQHSVDIDVECPVRTVYNQWTQFRDFPLFMKHVDEIQQTDDRHLVWTVSIAGVTRTWNAVITEQTPDERIAWTSTDGTRNRGVITFHALSQDRTRIRLQFEMDPAGFLEKVADWGGFVSDRVEKDLAGFKDFIEDRGHPTGGWRGRIDRSDQHAEAAHRHWLEQLTKDQLIDLASEEQIDGRSNMSRGELVGALVARRRVPVHQ